MFTIKGTVRKTPKNTPGKPPVAKASKVQTAFMTFARNTPHTTVKKKKEGNH
jgi:hypothetical protein